MSRQSSRARSEALLNMGRLGINLYHAGKLLRLGATLHRLAEAECNGDYPCDNGERKVRPCGVTATPRIEQSADATSYVWKLRTSGGSFSGVAPSETEARRAWQKIGEQAGCGSYYAPESLRKTRGYLCPSCCATEDAENIAAIYFLRAVVNGDPRGMVLGLVPMDTPFADVDSGKARPSYVY